MILLRLLESAVRPLMVRQVSLATVTMSQSRSAVGSERVLSCTREVRSRGIVIGSAPDMPSLSEADSPPLKEERVGKDQPIATPDQFSTQKKMRQMDKSLGGCCKAERRPKGFLRMHHCGDREMIGLATILAGLVSGCLVM